ncbi:hypothetical protein GCM10022239_03080 [Leifsonia bigeumensis]|uniref:Bacterial Pleckstrin homology domain-containing protein n=1 Tax=Leifsonella bigeumensis TaxID=433643 RepID=A0ABP7F1W7_9MICO
MTLVTLPLGRDAVLVRVVIPAMSILVLTSLLAGSLSLIWLPWRWSALLLGARGERGLTLIGAVGETERSLLMKCFETGLRSKPIGRAIVVIGDSTGLRFWRNSREMPFGSLTWDDIQRISVGYSSDYKLPTAVLEIDGEKSELRVLFPVVRRWLFSTVVMTSSELEGLVERLTQLHSP